jgi:putative endonuclease
VKEYVVYVLSNSAGTLYIGVTSDLDRRLFQHEDGHAPKSFVSRYNLDRLVYMETFPDPIQAITREKQLKGWSRAKKITLIRLANPEWRDLSVEDPTGMPPLTGG